VGRELIMLPLELPKVMSRLWKSDLGLPLSRAGSQFGARDKLIWCSFKLTYRDQLLALEGEYLGLVSF